VLGTKRLSLWELCEGNLEEGLLYWEPLKDIKRKAQEPGISPIGLPLGKLNGEFLARRL
jgi:hypothetical protein